MLVNNRQQQWCSWCYIYVCACVLSTPKIQYWSHFSLTLICIVRPFTQPYPQANSWSGVKIAMT